MSLGVGVIGTGIIGQDHIRRLRHVLPGAVVCAVTDVDLGVAGQVAEATGATLHPDGASLVRDPQVDAVMVCSWGPSHEEYVLACLAEGKPVFCEKPLATTEAACRRIVEAEVALGRRLVQVGFMRRYDPAYLALKQVVDSGDIGLPLLCSSSHRNASVPAHYRGDMAIVDTAVHDFDVARWLLGEEVTSIRVLAAKPNRRGGQLADPLLMTLETTSGVLVSVETSVNIDYGYDIRGEVIGECGTASLADGNPVVVRRQGSARSAVTADWRERFSLAYDNEVHAWITAVTAGLGATGPSAWDGLAAAAICDAGVAALRSGERAPVDVGIVPELYAQPVGSPR